jgi:hypothetical protein
MTNPYSRNGRDVSVASGHTASSAQATQQAPEPGDIVILCVERPPLGCEVAVSPGPPALRFGSYDKALDWARTSARRARVDVWVSEAKEITLVVRHRPDTTGRPRKARN